MGIAFKDTVTGGTWGTGTVSTPPDNVAVAVGDLIVVAVSCTDNVWATGVTDDADGGSNAYTVRPYVYNSYTSVVLAWCIAQRAHDNMVFTASFNNATGCGKDITVMVFTPDAGDTVTVDDSAVGGSAWQASPWETGTIDTTETDEVVVSAFAAAAAETYSDQLLLGTLPTTVPRTRDSCTFNYRILTATESGLSHAHVTATGAFSAEILAFKSVAGGGQTVTKTLNLDSYLQKIITKTPSMDGYLLKTLLKTLSLDSLASKLGITETASMDGYLLKTLLKTLSLDSLLSKLGITNPTSIDGYLLKTLVKISSIDSLLLKLGVTKSASIDSLLSSLGLLRISSIDSFLQKIGLTRTASIDSLLLKLSATKVASLDAILITLGGEQMQFLSIDALLNRIMTGQLSIDAVISKSDVAKFVLLSACLFNLRILATTIDGFIQINANRAAMLDAILIGVPGSQYIGKRTRARRTTVHRTSRIRPRG